MATIFDYYKGCPRDAIPEIICKLERKGRSEIEDTIKEMGITPVMVTSLLLTEIDRLHDNLISCRRAAKRIGNIRVRCGPIVTDDDIMKITESETNHIIRVVDRAKSGTDWYET